MLYQEFESIFGDIKLQYGALSKNSNEDDQKTKFYWRRFQGWTASDFRSVCDTIIDHWEAKPGMRFPMVRDFIRIYNGMTGNYDAQGKQDEIPENELASPGEFALLNEIVTIILKKHKRREQWNGKRLKEILIVDRKDILCFDDWDNAGRPPTWSPIYDQFAAGAIEPYRESVKDGGNDLLQYMANFRDLLVNKPILQGW